LKKNIDSINFHDSYITGLEFKTLNDHFDYFIINLESDDFIETFESNKIRINFKDCFQVKINAQMWVTGRDSVRKIERQNNSQWINEVEELNTKGFGPRASELNHFLIELNISSSVIEVLTKEIEIEAIE
jgi:histone deacetylase complex regulatory component SIN3